MLSAEDLYFVPMILGAIAIIVAIRFVHEEDRRSRGLLLFVGGIFVCLSYWMHLAHSGWFGRLTAFVFPLIVFLGLANLLFPKPPFRGAPIFKYTTGGNVVFAIGVIVSLVIAFLINSQPEFRHFLVNSYFQLGLP